MLKIGLTGGIGSGKSTVANHFSALGVPVIDADQVTRTLCLPGQPVLQEIVAAFGTAILDTHGQLKRAILRERIFSDVTARRTLEAIIHPCVRAEIFNQMQQLNAHYVVLVIPLLLESGQNYLVDRILVVDCNDELRIPRIMQRDKVSYAQIEAIFSAQITHDTRLAAAHDIIINNFDFDNLYLQVNALHQRYLQMES